MTKFKFAVIKNCILKRHEILFLLFLINLGFCLYGNISYFTQAKTFGFCIFDSNIFLHTATNDYIGNQTRLNAEKTAQTLSYDRKLGRLVGVLYFGANSVESDSRLDRITPPIYIVVLILIYKRCLLNITILLPLASSVIIAGWYLI